MPWRRPSDRTELVHIVVTGYHKKSSPRKHYVFVVDVTWNNNERYEIYRRYSDFFSFQTQLKTLFPVAAGRRSGERVIPQLPKRIFVGRSHVARVAEARLEQINRYCQTLISLEPRVSESAHVVGFFSPRVTDKQLPKLQLHRPPSLHPLDVPAGSLFQEYCALADYHAEEPSQVSFKSGDKVLVMSKDESGWWMCECHGNVGWAPPSYLKSSAPEEDSDSDQEQFLGLPESYSDGSSETDSLKSAGFHLREIEAEEYTAIDSHEPQGEGQIAFAMGDTIHVLDKLEDGWWFVCNGDEEGWAPCSYLERLDHDLSEDDTVSSLDVEKYTTVEPYSAEEQDELSFAAGLAVDVLQKSLDGWWLVKLVADGTTGLAPATLLKKAEMVLDSNQMPVRRVTPPSPLEALAAARPFTQPPRKQSVRYKASLKSRAARSKLSQIKERDSKSDSPEPGSPHAARSSPNAVHSKNRRFESDNSYLSEEKPPVPPRPGRPAVSPKPQRMKQKSHSSEELKLGVPPLKPSRPEASELERVTPRISKPEEELPPLLPHRPQRPRQSEIRRSRDKSPARGDHPLLNGGSHSKSRSNSAASDTPSSSLSPPQPELHPRRKSEGSGENPINQEMADTLIKYILASNDPSLKLALRNIVTSDPQVLKSLNEE